MLITRHASRLILGKPTIRLDRLRSYDSYWSCGCRARTMDSGTVEILWCREHGEIFDNADLKLQA
jgi:hypothetical protein